MPTAPISAFSSRSAAMGGEETPGRAVPACLREMLRAVPAYLGERICPSDIARLATMIEDLFAIADEMYGMLNHHESLPCNCRACELKRRLEDLKC